MATPTTSLVTPPAAGAIHARLFEKYGEVMLVTDVAGELKTSTNAIRIALHRGTDMPRPADLPGRGHRFLTLEFASWLAEHVVSPAPTEATVMPRRPGRPRGTVRRVAG